MADPLLMLLLFTRRLAEARSRANRSVEQAAQLIGVSIAEYRAFEAGQRWPTDEEWDRISEATGISRTFDLADPFDEDADIRSHLAALGPAALGERRAILERSDRTPVLRFLMAPPASADLATLIAMADTDEVVRLRLLRAIRDLGA